ncbi:MAG: hypothetical protein WA101_03365 [Minisyncoccia bacterium]
MNNNKSKTTTLLLEKNKAQSAEFIKPANKSSRQYHRAKHPTEIAAFKCMDGRLNLPVITNVPQGIIQPYRQIAGVFDLGDPYLGSLIEGWVDYSISKARKCLVLSTYHFSKGDHHRGCAGHQENTKQALEWAKRLVNQHKLVFGEVTPSSIVFPVVVGIETDTDGLIFHGYSGKTFAVFDNLDLSAEEISDRITEIYPEMPTDVRNDLMILVSGNCDHVKKTKKEERDLLELVHGESIICIGRGFGWLHEPNKALIIGPYENELFSLEDAIETAGNIVLKNIKEGRVSKTDGVTVMCSSLFLEEGMNRMRETVKAFTLFKVAKKVLSEKVPELADCNLQFLVGSTNQDDWLFREIDPNSFNEYFESNIGLSDEELKIIESSK